MKPGVKLTDGNGQSWVAQPTKTIALKDAISLLVLIVGLILHAAYVAREFGRLETRVEALYEQVVDHVKNLERHESADAKRRRIREEIEQFHRRD